MSAKLNTKIKNSRFFYMYRYGLDEFAVAKFLKQSKAELTKSGAKGAMSLPEEFTFRAAFLSTLPPKCFPILSGWFNKNMPEGELSDLQDAIDVLSKAGENFDHAKESSKKHWRTIFLNYINNENTLIVKSFLMGEKTLKIAQPSKLPPKEMDAKVKLSGKEDVNVVSGADKESLIIKKNEKQPYGFSYSECKKLDLANKNESDGRPVLGEVVKKLDHGQFFIDIKGILIGSDLIEITESQAMNLYPEQGSAVGFPEKISNISITDNLLAIWNVHDQANSKKARFMIDSCVNIVLEVFEIPHNFSEPDLVRAWLKNSYIPKEGIFPVFELADGIIIKPSSLLNDFRVYDFSTPFLGYYNHEAVKWNGKKIVIKPFPAHSFKYECVTTEIAVKRLFKFKSEVSSFPVITSKQIQELAYLVNQESTDKSFSNSYLSISNRISEIYTIKDNVDMVINEILDLPEVKLRIQDEVDELKKQITRELVDENKQIDSLRREKKLIEESVKKSSDLLRREVKKAFDGAVKNGESTLSQVALLKPFLTGHSSGSIDYSTTNSDIVIDFSKKNELKTFKNLSTYIGLNSLRYGFNKNLLATFITLGFTRGVVGVFGKNYKILVDVISKVISDGFYSSVSLSVDNFSFNDLLNLPAQSNCLMGDGLLLGDLLEIWQEQDFPLIIVLNGFNRIPPESIINELLDMGNFLKEKRHFIWKKSNGEVKKLILKVPVIFILNFVYGRSTFPIPKAYASEIPLLSSEFFNIEKLDEDLEISVNHSHLGQIFYSERLSLVDHADDIELLQLMDLSESEAISYLKLFFGIGRISQNELLSNLGDSIFLDSLNLNCFTSDHEKYIFES